ncbi:MULTISPECIES: PTS cellobiose transporter subunit IIC [unclassified Fusobacterium]|uniref:PTS cellobiose transporter subunit IIC n=1 Tax=unclassified Fusobacterium TaxID=2648384 RepID=UPI002630A6E2|nr:PTS cellobiose transporter subunit IIC [Fusobacterium sp.]
MDKVMYFLEKYLLPIAEKLGQSKYLNVLRDSFMLSFPLTIFGSIFIVIANLPFLNLLMSDDKLAILKGALAPAAESSMLMMTVFVVMGIGYYLTSSYNIEGIFGSAIGVSAFFLVTPLQNGGISLDRLGAKGMFVGMLVGFASAEIYRRAVQKGWTIKMPDSVPPAVAKSFSALVPGFVTLAVFLIVRIIFSLTPFENIHDFIFVVIQTPMVKLGGGLIATVIAIILIQLLWFFGLHGQTIVNSVLDPVWNTLSLQNLEAYQAGKELPNIITKQFIETYTVGLGGTGMTIAVVFALLFVVKSRQLKELGKLAGPSAIFNVNEPITFGLPIVMNPLVFVPWLLAPIVVVIFTYIMMAVGLAPIPTGVIVPWTVPVFFSGVLATNSVMGGVLQIVNCFIVFIIWLPFLKVLDRKALEMEAKPQEEDLDLEL